METNTIVYRYHVDRVLTPADVVRRTGFSGFVVMLLKNGWIDKEYKMKRDFEIRVHTNNEDDQHYVEWAGILREYSK